MSTLQRERWNIFELSEHAESHIQDLVKTTGQASICSSTSVITEVQRQQDLLVRLERAEDRRRLDEALKEMGRLWCQNDHYLG